MDEYYDDLNELYADHDVNTCRFCGSQQCVSFRGADCPVKERMEAKLWAEEQLREAHANRETTTRTVNGWTVTAGVDEAFSEAYNEDGPYTRRTLYALVTAASARGELFAALPATLDAAKTLLASLPADFDPDKDDRFNFARNIYGSEAYADNWEGEEYDRMDDGERRRYHSGW